MDKPQQEGHLQDVPEAVDAAYIKKRKIVSIVSLIIFIALFAWLTFAVGGPLVQLAQEPEKFRAWIDEKGMLGQLLFVGMQVLQVVIAMIPGEVLEVGAGYAFGAWEGTLLCMVGVAIGSTLIFLLTKRFGLKLVEAFVPREKIQELKFFKKEKRLELLIFLVFFIPGTPKDLLTYFAGLTPIKLSRFLILTSIARIPSLVSSTFGGHALGEQNYTFAIIVFAVTGLVSLLGLGGYGLLMKHKNKQAQTEEAQSAQENEQR